jgi:hypothetical protein
MEYIFTQDDIKQISGILGEPAQSYKNNWVWMLSNSATKESIVVSLYNNIQLGKNSSGSMLSVQTLHGYFEIHDCSGYLIFEPDEVIFVQASDLHVSCMIIGKQCTCSMYSNIKREILNADFTTLDPAVLLSAMQLSLTEGILMDL